MTKSITIVPAPGPVRGSIRPPGSKSITNRALVCAALANGPTKLLGALQSDDTEVMIESLRRLGVSVKVDQVEQSVSIEGASAEARTGGCIPFEPAELFVGNSGTTIRFLTPLVTLGRGAFRLDGVARMRERPIGDLLDALSQLGAVATSENDNRCPPVTVRANGLPGGEATVRGDISSQFLSGLLMTAPCARSLVVIRVDGELVSKPYVEMTLEVMQAFGVEVCCSDSLDRFDVPYESTYVGRNYSVEPDASAASYFWAAAAITGGEVTVEGLSRKSLQGDVAFVDCLERMGCEVDAAEDRMTVCGGELRGVDVDMNAISDTVQTLAAVALFADGPTTIRNVGHIRHKETDRIADLATELKKLGARVEEGDEGLTILPGALRAAEIETYDDHRMAMSLALVGLKTPGVTIRDPDCTKKTYPGFFRDLEWLVAGGR